MSNRPFTPKAERQIRADIVRARESESRGDRAAGNAAIDQALAAANDPKNRQS